MKKKIILLGSLLGFLFLLLIVKPVISPIQPPKPQWQTYQNSKYGFQFNYPISWQKEEWDLETATGYKAISDGTILYQGKFFGRDGHLEILVWENNGRASIKNYLTWYRHEDLNLADLPLAENGAVASISAIRHFQQKTARGKPVLYYFFTKENLVFELTQERLDLVNLTAEEATQSAQFFSSVYDPIIQSFQFAKLVPTIPPESPR